VTRKDLGFHPAAIDEAETATEWYLQRSKRAAVAFLHEVERVFERIADAPEQFPMFDFGTQRAFLHRFPYVIVFRETVAGVEIIAIAHGRRRPGYWQGRLR
jgi:plasmid stabilization system protein ParE